MLFFVLGFWYGSESMRGSANQGKTVLAVNFGIGRSRPTCRPGRKSQIVRHVPITMEVCCYIVSFSGCSVILALGSFGKCNILCMCTRY